MTDSLICRECDAIDQYLIDQSISIWGPTVLESAVHGHILLYFQHSHQYFASIVPGSDVQVFVVASSLKCDEEQLTVIIAELKAAGLSCLPIVV